MAGQRVSLLSGVVPRLPRREAGAGSAPCLEFGLNARWEKAGDLGVWSSGLSQRPAGREGPAGTCNLGQVRTCLRPSFLLALGDTSQGGASWGREPQHRRHWHVLMPRTDSVPSALGPALGEGPRTLGQVTTTGSQFPACQKLAWSGPGRLPRSVCPPGAELA